MEKNVLFILIGILSIGLSISCFKADTGDFVRKESYGGDAYTGIQHAAAETGQNVRALAKITSKGFGSVLLISGMTLIVLGLPGAKKKDENTLDSANNTTEDPK